MNYVLADHRLNLSLAKKNGSLLLCIVDLILSPDLQVSIIFMIAKIIPIIRITNSEKGLLYIYPKYILLSPTMPKQIIIK